MHDLKPPIDSSAGGFVGLARRYLARSIIGASIVLAFGSQAVAHSLEDMEEMLGDKERYLQVVDYPAPDFTLQDADGRTVSLAGLRGKVVVLYFIYASCPDVCPLQSEKLAGIQKKINTTPMRDIVQFVAITTDPEHDSPDVLEAYGPTHGLDASNWMFLTSGSAEPAATRDLAAAYGLQFTPGEGGTQMHGIVTHVIDKSGDLRARFHGLRFDDLNLILYVNALSNDDH